MARFDCFYCIYIWLLTHYLLFLLTIASTTLPENWRGEIPATQTSTSSTSSGGSIQDASASTASKNDDVPKVKAKDDWAFRYRHSKSSMTFVLKALRLGSRLSCHAYVIEQDDIIASVELSVPQFVDSSSDSFKSMVAASSTDSPVYKWTPFLKDLDTLHKQFKAGVMTKLMPEVEDLANQIRLGAKSSSAASAAPDASNQPRRDPLMVGEPRRPMGSPHGPHGGYPSAESRDDYGTPGSFAHYGDADLFGAAGRYAAPGFAAPDFGLRGGTAPGYGGIGAGRGGGGNQVGPDHPGFGPVNDPYRGGGDFGGRPPGAPDGPYAHPPPRGARFDPFGPPINPHDRPASGSRNPEGPPGFDNWYA